MASSTSDLLTVAAMADILTLKKVARAQFIAPAASPNTALLCSLHLDLRVSLRVSRLLGAGQISYEYFRCAHLPYLQDPSIPIAIRNLQPPNIEVKD